MSYGYMSNRGSAVLTITGELDIAPPLLPSGGVVDKNGSLPVVDSPGELASILLVGKDRPHVHRQSLARHLDHPPTRVDRARRLTLPRIRGPDTPLLCFKVPGLATGGNERGVTEIGCAIFTAQNVDHELPAVRELQAEPVPSLLSLGKLRR